MSLKELGASINLLIINNQSCQWPKTDKNLMKFSHFVFSKVYEWMECKGISLNHIMTLFISFNYKTLMKKTCFAFWPKYRWPHEGKLSSAYTWTLVLKNNERAFFSNRSCWFFGWVCQVTLFKICFDWKVTQQL